MGEQFPPNQGDPGEDEPLIQAAQPQTELAEMTTTEANPSTGNGHEVHPRGSMDDATLGRLTKHIYDQLAKAPAGLPGESEYFERSESVADRRLSIADQRIQMAVQREVDQRLGLGPQFPGGIDPKILAILKGQSKQSNPQ